MNIKLLVCDLDNTLYDWVGYFVPSFYKMVDEVVRITSCDREKLLDDFREVHKSHHDSEHPFSLLETQTIRDLYPGYSRDIIAKKLDSAFHAFNESRAKTLRLYPLVDDTLKKLIEKNISIVAHTESRLYSVVDRLRRLGIEKYFSRIYCRERSNTEHPNISAGGRWLESFPMNRVSELSHHQRKPNPEVLIEICHRQKTEPARAAYVGDSMARDISMAQVAGLYSIWAKYGAFHLEDEYKKLIRISHWTSDDVVRERRLSEMSKSIVPDCILNDGFYEIIDAIT